MEGVCKLSYVGRGGLLREGPDLHDASMYYTSSYVYTGSMMDSAERSPLKANRGPISLLRPTSSVSFT